MSAVGTPTLELPDHLIIHVLYGLLLEDPYEVAAKIHAISQELDIPCESDQHSIMAVVSRVETLYELPKKNQPISEMDLLERMSWYRELCRSSNDLSQRERNFDAAALRTNTEAYSTRLLRFIAAGNPHEFYDGQQGYLETQGNKRRFDGLKRYEFTYTTVTRKNDASLLSHLPTLNKRLCGAGFPPLQYPLELKVFVWISEGLHQSLCQGGQSARSDVMIDVGGGGMTTGDPRDPVWQPLAFIDAIKQYRIIYVKFERLSLVGSSGTEIIDHGRDFIKFMRTDFPTRMSEMYPQVEFSTQFIMACESAGAQIVADWIAVYPTLFKGILFRSALLGSYVRDPGKYMHREVSLEESAKAVVASFRAQKSLGEMVPPIKSVATPFLQFSAYTYAVTGTWEFVWDTPVAQERLLAAKEPVTKRLMLFMHGSKDTKVSFESIERNVSELKKKGFNVLLHKHEGEDHCSDYDWPLLDDRLSCLRSFLSTLLVETISKKH